MAFFLSRLDEVLDWAQTNSLAYLPLDLACCGIEMMHVMGGRYDIERFGSAPTASPKHADLLIVSGTITYKYAELLKQLYAQMSEPKYVMGIGSCVESGGMFSWEYSYSTVSGADKLIPVDVFVPGCPPRPEAIMHGLLTLQKGIQECRVKTSSSAQPSARS